MTDTATQTPVRFPLLHLDSSGIDRRSSLAHVDRSSQNSLDEGSPSFAHTPPQGMSRTLSNRDISQLYARGASPLSILTSAELSGIHATAEVGLHKRQQEQRFEFLEKHKITVPGALREQIAIIRRERDDANAILGSSIQDILDRTDPKAFRDTFALTIGSAVPVSGMTSCRTSPRSSRLDADCFRSVCRAPPVLRTVEEMLCNLVVAEEPSARDDVEAEALRLFERVAFCFKSAQRKAIKENKVSS